LDELAEFFYEKGYQFEEAGDKYKIKVKILPEKKATATTTQDPKDEEEKAPEPVAMTINILKVDEEKNCVEFKRTGGDQIEFFNQFNGLMENAFADLADATY
jgi:hypothetical protein